MALLATFSIYVIWVVVTFLYLIKRIIFVNPLSECSWGVWVNLGLVIIAGVVLLIRLSFILTVGIGETAEEAAKVYRKMDEKNKKVLHKIVLRMINAIFFMLKERKGKFGDFCRKF